MQCISGGRCVPVCEHHWGDCDEDFHNGCEQSIADRHYCPGDPRIGAVSDPSVSFFVREDETNMTDPNRQTLARSLVTQTADLQRCYQTVLARNPGLAGESAYRITFSEAGAAHSLNRLAIAPDDPTLSQCAEQAVRATKIDRSDHPGAPRFIVEIAFAPGGPDTDAE
jgi:hypothetical protein